MKNPEDDRTARDLLFVIAGKQAKILGMEWELGDWNVQDLSQFNLDLGEELFRLNDRVRQRGPL